MFQQGIDMIYIINAFIIIYLLYAFSWSLPHNSYFKHLIVKYFAGWVVNLGLWHSWNMFSGPSQNIDTLDLELTLEDQSKKVVEVFTIKNNRRLFLGRRAGVRDVKFAENLIYKTEFSEMTRMGFLKYMVRYLKLDKKIISGTYVKKSQNMKLWHLDNQIYTKEEVLQTINL